MNGSIGEDSSGICLRLSLSLFFGFFEFLVFFFFFFFWVFRCVGEPECVLELARRKDFFGFGRVF